MMLSVRYEFDQAVRMVNTSQVRVALMEHFDVRGIPAPGPLRCRFHTEHVQNGFLQEDSELWNSTGTLLAQGRQLALVPRT